MSILIETVNRILLGVDSGSKTVSIITQKNTTKLTTVPLSTTAIVSKKNTLISVSSTSKTTTNYISTVPTKLTIETGVFF